VRINSRKKKLKNSRKDLSAPKRIFATFCTHETPRCIDMNATHTQPIYLIQKNNQRFFSYTIFPVNKINVENFFKKI
jgi:hypothetical protein